MDIAEFNCLLGFHDIGGYWGVVCGGARESDEYEALGCYAADERGGGDNDGDVEVQHGGFGGRKDHAVGRDESSRRGPSVASLGGRHAGRVRSSRRACVGSGRS